MSQSLRWWHFSEDTGGSDLLDHVSSPTDLSSEQTLIELQRSSTNPNLHSDAFSALTAEVFNHLKAAGRQKKKKPSCSDEYLMRTETTSVQMRGGKTAELLLLMGTRHLHNLHQEFSSSISGCSDLLSKVRIMFVNLMEIHVLTLLNWQTGLKDFLEAFFFFFLINKKNVLIENRSLFV